jgi:hypothetical protein
MPKNPGDPCNSMKKHLVNNSIEQRLPCSSAKYSQAMQEDLKDILGVPSIQQYEKYLGLPSLIGKEKITCFSQIKERVWSKVKGWKEKLLSQAGREILIKAVVQAIPTYTMNCFKLPVTLCKEIEGIIRRFWWGQKW